MYKQDLALNNLQGLIYFLFVHLFVSIFVCVCVCVCACIFLPLCVFVPKRTIFKKFYFIYLFIFLSVKKTIAYSSQIKQRNNEDMKISLKEKKENCVENLCLKKANKQIQTIKTLYFCLL